MTSNRPILFFALLLVGYFLYNTWQQDYGPKTAVSAPTASTSAIATKSTGDLPTGAPSSASVPPPPAATGASSEERAASTVDVQTDLLLVAISTAGGSVVRADLSAYPIDPSDKSKPVRLFDDSAEHYF